MPEPSPTSVSSLVRASLLESQRVLGLLLADSIALTSVAGMADVLCECFRRGGKVMIAGNGGSLCDAAHFAEELTGRFRDDRMPFPAIAIAEPGHITCTANDYGFDHVFSRSIEALGRAGDVFIALSTSGNSANCLRAVETAKARKMSTFALLGKRGGQMAGRCDLEVIVAGETSDRIQELHMLILHILVEAVEAGMRAR